MKKLLIGAVITSAVSGAFIAGFECGARFVHKEMVDKLVKVTPLMINALTTLSRRAYDENLSHDEFKKLLEDELDFVSIAMKEES